MQTLLKILNMLKTLAKIAACLAILLYAMITESRITELEAQVMVLEFQMQHVSKSVGRISTISY